MDHIIETSGLHPNPLGLAIITQLVLHKLYYSSHTPQLMSLVIHGHGPSNPSLSLILPMHLYPMYTTIHPGVGWSSRSSHVYYYSQVWFTITSRYSYIHFKTLSQHMFHHHYITLIHIWILHCSTSNDNRKTFFSVTNNVNTSFAYIHVLPNIFAVCSQFYTHTIGVKNDKMTTVAHNCKLSCNMAIFIALCGIADNIWCDLCMRVIIR